ncbi:hypothetical protein [Microlunatus elymi]|uniref:hypothetical protein n=1 Tax=Microlunatus elymi TaxID=2596828 RepID=UPI00143CC7E8|nr:hypothetical protein [Microlunatus elymi]
MMLGLVTPIAQQIAAMETELPVPPIVFGIIAFCCLLAMMAIVLSIGKGRPHS